MIDWKKYGKGHSHVLCLSALIYVFDGLQAGRLGEIAGAEERYEATRQAVKNQKQGGTWDKDQKEL